MIDLIGRSVIFYFSGTGNSLYVAKHLSDETGFPLCSIAKYLQGAISIQRIDQMILVFPMYNHSYPSIIEDLINKLSEHRLLDKTHITGICTYGNDLGITLRQLNKKLKSLKGQLSLGFGIQMPYNYVQPKGFKLGRFYDSFKLVHHSDSDIQEANEEAFMKVRQISPMIHNKGSEELEASSVFIESVVDRLGLQNTIQKKVWAKVAGTKTTKEETFFDMVKHMDEGFSISEDCTQCGLCSSICPVNNITMSKGNIPEFSHNCEQCFACVSWCPVSAVNFRNATQGLVKYSNPEITATDMLNKMD
jgi:ferredoxin/flavodoxin